MAAISRVFLTNRWVPIGLYSQQHPGRHTSLTRQMPAQQFMRCIHHTPFRLNGYKPCQHGGGHGGYDAKGFRAADLDISI